MIKKPSGDRRDKKQQGRRGEGIGRIGYLEEF